MSHTAHHKPKSAPDVGEAALRSKIAVDAHVSLRSLATVEYATA